MKPKLVVINWEDAITPTSGWTNIKELENTLADCISIGLVVEENDKTITLVSHISGTINKLKIWLLENADAQKNR
jgi:hypothetical protein